MVVTIADPCLDCGKFHYYGVHEVHRMIHALERIAEMAARSDAHPDLQFEAIAREALHGTGSSEPAGRGLGASAPFGGGDE